MTEKLDGDEYAGSEAITIKIPFSLPYPLPEGQYERVNGQFEHRGEIYRLVKQKYYNDTLYVVCIKDTKGKVIKDAFSEYAATLTGKPADTTDSNKTRFLSIKDFISCDASPDQPATDGKIIINHNIYITSSTESFVTVPEHPPESKFMLKI